MNTLLLIIGIIAIVVIALFLMLAFHITKQDTEFSGKDLVNPNSPDWFPNFDIFKRIAHKLADNDEEIKRYLMDRKNRLDSIHASIPDSDVDRKADGKDISPDI